MFGGETSRVSRFNRYGILKIAIRTERDSDILVEALLGEVSNQGIVAAQFFIFGLGVENQPIPDDGLEWTFKENAHRHN